MNRIFISYRSSDGFKDANRLVTDLNRVFGADQVFFDKQDLRGGSSWRNEIMKALGEKQVVLALITPDYFGAADGAGFRIEREDDPVREEIIAARDTNAHIIPLLSEGMKMPAAASLPDHLQFITSRHALKLRSEDWHNDVPRLIDDIAASGLKVKDGNWRVAFGIAPLVRSGRWLAAAVAAFLIVIGLEFAITSEGKIDADDYFGAAIVGLMPLGAGWYAWRVLKNSARKFRITAMVMFFLSCWQILSYSVRGAQLQSGAPATTTATTPQVDLTGVWNVEIVRQGLLSTGPLLPFTVTQTGVNVKMQTDSFDAAKDPNVAAMNKIAASTHKGIVLTTIRLKGTGTLNGRELNVLMNFVTGADETAFATGTLTAQVEENNRVMTGELKFIGDNQPQVLKLTRR